MHRLVYTQCRCCCCCIVSLSASICSAYCYCFFYFCQYHRYLIILTEFTIVINLNSKNYHQNYSYNRTNHLTLKLTKQPLNRDYFTTSIYNFSKFIIDNRYHFFSSLVFQYINLKITDQTLVNISNNHIANITDPFNILYTATKTDYNKGKFISSNKLHLEHPMAEESVDSGISSELYTGNTDQNLCQLTIGLQPIQYKNDKQELQSVKSSYTECVTPKNHVVSFGNYPCGNSKTDYGYPFRFHQSENNNNSKHIDKRQLLEKFKKSHFSSFDSAIETSSESTLSLVSSLSGSYRNSNYPRVKFNYSNFIDHTNCIEELNRNMTDNPNKQIYQDFYPCDKQSNRYNLNEGKNVSPRVHFVQEDGTNKTNLPGPSRSVFGI
ncbi:unnamed protein product [Heterobilharzia americana]|nr:unnamed protein product [Heterobilharzia americana]